MGHGRPEFEEFDTDTVTVQRVLGRTNASPGVRKSRRGVSTTFYPGALTKCDSGITVDLIIISSDQTYFYVPTSYLLSTSNNAFSRLLPVRCSVEDSGNNYDLLHVKESSAIVNVVLHSVFDMSCRHYNPTLEELAGSLIALEKYGLPLNSHVSRSSRLFDILLSHAATSPLEVYALATSNELEELAIATSAHLLSLNLHSLTDEHALRIGPIYLKRLYLLHVSRTEALREIVAQPPKVHVPTPACDREQQGSLTRAWAMVTAYFSVEARPDMETITIEVAVQSLQVLLSCELCKAALTNRLRILISRWSAVKTTI